MVVGGNQSGKGAKGLLMGKAAALPVVDNKDKKKPTSRSSRAGLQVRWLFFPGAHGVVVLGVMFLVVSLNAVDWCGALVFFMKLMLTAALWRRMT